MGSAGGSPYPRGRSQGERAINQPTRALSPQDLPTLFRHTRRPGWGLAILAWEGRDRRRYQFQDGRLRTIKRGFYELLEPVDAPLDTVDDLVGGLRSQLDLARARREVVAQAKTDGRKVIPFDDQVRVFRHLYPEGFQDPTYLHKIRGHAAPKRLKRHREAAIEAARGLGQEQLAGWIQAGRFDSVRDATLAFLAQTDLVTKRDRTPLERLPEAETEPFARALFDLLHGVGDYAERFDRLLRILRRGCESVSWPLMTALPALVHPADHVAVKPAAFRLQARWMAPKLKLDSAPSGKQYQRLLAMAFMVRRRLEQADLEPADLLDVSEFVWATLRPQGLELRRKLTGRRAS